jgi:hypothetical protein
MPRWAEAQIFIKWTNMNKRVKVNACLIMALLFLSPSDGQPDGQDYVAHSHARVNFKVPESSLAGARQCRLNDHLIDAGANVSRTHLIM